MHLTFRPIRRDEIPKASQLVDAAYAPQIRNLYGNTRLGRWKHYEETRIASYVEREPNGVRVGLFHDEIITFNVCRSFGRLGWFHTLAVHPRFQGQGLGRQAVADAESYLASQGVSSIALMTWPTAIANLAFYLRLAYRLKGISVYAYREANTSLITGRSPFYASIYGEASADNPARINDAARVLMNRIMPGLDYLPWLAWALGKDFADTLLLWHGQQLYAMILAYFLPGTSWAEGKLMLIHPDLSLPDHLWILEHIRFWVHSRGRDAFGLPVDLSSDFARQVLLPYGFRFYPESMVNLVKGDDLPDPAFHFVRFGG